MKRIRLWLARGGAFVLVLIFSTWTALKGLAAAIGATTMGDDLALLMERLPDILKWLYATPWWVPALCAVALTVLFIWLSLPPPAPVATASPVAPPPSNPAASGGAAHATISLEALAELRMVLDVRITNSLTRLHQIAVLAMEVSDEYETNILRPYWALLNYTYMWSRRAVMAKIKALSVADKVTVEQQDLFNFFQEFLDYYHGMRERVARILITAGVSGDLQVKVREWLPFDRQMVMAIQELVNVRIPLPGLRDRMIGYDLAETVFQPLLARDGNLPAAGGV